MAAEIAKLFSKPTEEAKPAPVATGDDFLKMLGAKVKYVNPAG